MHVLHASLKFMGYTTDKFYTHSFRIGAATYLSKLGYSNEEIQKGAGGCQTVMNGIFDFNSVLIFLRNENSVDSVMFLNAKCI